MEDMMSVKGPDQIRLRLGEISDELRALPSTDFESKHRLNTEADTLRGQLSELGQDSDVSRQWAERAARKSSHTADDDVEAAKAAIVSPIEPGGAA